MSVGFNSLCVCVCVCVCVCACVRVCVWIQCYATLKHISTLVLSICSQLQASDCHSASHNNQHFVLLYCSLVNMHVLALVNITLLAFRCCLNFLLTGNCKLFHSILSYLFFRSQSWGRVSFQGDKESHEVVTFVFLVIHKVLAIPKHLCLCSSMKCLENHLAQILWKPSLAWMIWCVEPWLIWRWPATSLSLFIKNHVTDISSVLVGSGSRWSPQLFYFSYICACIFELVIPFLHAWTMKK